MLIMTRLYLRKYDKALPEKVEDVAASDTVELDELYTFVGKKSARRS
jgi:hypothetical protein